MSTWKDDLPAALRADYAITGNQDSTSLRNMVKALSMHSMLNSAEENQRLEAAKRILAYRKGR